jgi:activator of 2-hydroxyglutaryl-CoA dehydratase
VSAAFTTAGIDLGIRSVKVVLLSHLSGESRWLASEIGRAAADGGDPDVRAACRQAWSAALAAAGLTSVDVALVASTGVSECASLSVGHFYEHLTLIDGGRPLSPAVRAVVDARPEAGGASLQSRLCDKAVYAGALGAALLAAQRYRRFTAFSILRGRSWRLTMPGPFSRTAPRRPC